MNVLRAPERTTGLSTYLHTVNVAITCRLQETAHTIVLASGRYFVETHGSDFHVDLPAKLSLLSPESHLETGCILHITVGLQNVKHLETYHDAAVFFAGATSALISSIDTGM